LQAAIHAARRKVATLVLGRLNKSSAFGSHIDNFCCVDGKNGSDLLRQAQLKAQESGAVFLEEDVVDIKRADDSFSVETDTGRKLESMALVLAMGVHRNKLGIKGEKELLGHGVSHCVDCDAGFFKDEVVAMVGGESAAVAGALVLLFYAREVHLICDKMEVSDSLAERLNDSSVKVHEGRKVVQITGDSSVEGVIMDDGTRIDVSGVFIELGAKGAVALAGKLGVESDRETMKYIAANRKQETSIQGIYAAGDICGPPWQVAKAVGEGCVAGLEAAAYAKKARK
ncbi:MAG: NAD(P)/FAD-dependent oxidoreductase, partial [Desulfobacterales bacterium]